MLWVWSHRPSRNTCAPVNTPMEIPKRHHQIAYSDQDKNRQTCFFISRRITVEVLEDTAKREPYNGKVELAHSTVVRLLLNGNIASKQLVFVV